MNFHSRHWQNAKEMYHADVFDDAEMRRLKRRWSGTGMTAKQGRKDAKARALLRAMLERERAQLDRMTVNAHSAELLKVAAPEQYDLLKSYFDRRIHSVWDD